MFFRADGGSAHSRRRASDTGRRAVGAHLCASERCGGQGLPACVVGCGRAHLLAAFRRLDGGSGLAVSGNFRTGYSRYHGCRSLDLLPAGLVVARQWRADCGFGLFHIVLLALPGGRFVPRWTRWLAVAFSAFLVSRDLFPDLYYRSPALEWISFMAFLGIVVSITWSLAYRYRRISSPEQRRQTRWVVFGTTLAIAGTFPFQLPVDLALLGGDTPLALLLLRTGFAFSFLLVPLSISVAVLRSHLFDIDVLINRTLVYGTLTAMLLGLYLGGIVVLQLLFVVLTGEKSTLAVVASTLLIAALFNPLRRRIQSFIDRGFYRKKYDARKTLESFSAKLRDETDLDALSDDLVGVVKETMQPEHVTLWLRPDTASSDRHAD